MEEKRKEKGCWVSQQKKESSSCQDRNTLTDNLPAAKHACTPLTCPSLCRDQKLQSSLKNAIPPPANGIQYTKQEI
eukprot:11522093-Ditylum_brightwellii.AAC.1